MLQQAFVQGTQEPGRAPNPVGQRRAVELDALPGIDLGLAAERQVIRVLSDDDMGDQPFGRQAALDQPRRRWCLHPEYAVGDGEHVRAQFAAVRTPTVSLSFADDELMSARNIESIHGFYVNAPRTMKRIAPREVGARRIGHFGFFRAAFEQSLWREHLLPELA